MNKLNFYKYAAGFLLALNLLGVGFFIMKGQHGPPHNKGEKTKAHEVMNLSDEQMSLFHGFVQNHIDLMNGYNEAQVVLLEPYFSNSDQNQDSIMVQVLDIEQEKIESVSAHFSDIKSILNEDQLSSFESFKKDVIGRILMRKTKNKPPGQKQ